MSSTPTKDRIDAALQPAVEAVGKAMGFEPTGVHVNYGQSEDYTKGFNAGYDAYERCDGPDCQDAPDPEDLPAEDPWLSAYKQGWEDGWATARELEDDDEAWWEGGE